MLMGRRALSELHKSGHLLPVFSRSTVLLQAYVEREEGNCEVEYVACGSGLERIYRFLQSDEGCNRPTVDLTTCQVLVPSHPVSLLVTLSFTLAVLWAE